MYQLVTYRLADSLPKEKLDRLEQELQTVEPKRIDQVRRQKIETWLDSGHGSCLLKNPECARIVINAWQHFDGERYKLVAWTVMPNHVHVLFQQLNTHSLAEIISSWKKFTARKINAIHANVDLQIEHRCSEKAHPPKNQSLWQRDYWDRFIRNEEHFEHAIEYIKNNAVKAGLAKTPDEWPWCGTSGA